MGIRLKEFLGLEDSDQWDTLWDEGRLISEVEEPEDTYQLYALGSFYVEIVFDTVSSKTLGMSAFVDGPRLDKHLPNL